MRDNIVIDDYYKTYREYLRRSNLSKVCFRRVFYGILNAHGISVDYSILLEPFEKETIQEQKVETDIVK